MHCQLGICANILKPFFSIVLSFLLLFLLHVCLYTLNLFDHGGPFHFVHAGAQLAKKNTTGQRISAMEKFNWAKDEMWCKKTFFLKRKTHTTRIFFIKISGSGFFRFLINEHKLKIRRMRIRRETLFVCVCDIDRERN